MNQTTLPFDGPAVTTLSPPQAPPPDPPSPPAVVPGPTDAPPELPSPADEPPAVAVEPSALPPWTNTRRQSFDRIGPVAGRIASRVFAAIYTAGADGRTDEEVAVILGMKESTTRARRVELRDAGLVIDSGRRRRTSSGRAAAVWACPPCTPPGGPVGSPDPPRPLGAGGTIDRRY